MEAIANFMQNESAVLALSIFALSLSCLTAIALIAIAVASTLTRRVAGGFLVLSGVLIIIGMFVFARAMTSTMELQYGPQGALVEFSIYTVGISLCVAGYARLTWWTLRNGTHER